MMLDQYVGKAVRITLTDGQVYTGLAYDYISELDNEPDPASITIGSTELLETEIKSIQVLES